MDSKVKYPTPQGNPETRHFWEQTVEAADQFRRLRHEQPEDRPEGESRVQANRRRTAAVLYAGVRLKLRLNVATQMTGIPAQAGIQ